MLPVLKASLHDVRYFSAMLRGVNFVDKASVTITKRGFVVTAEEARTLLGTAFVFAAIFDEYEYHSEAEQVREADDTVDGDNDDDEEDTTAFELPLNTLIECLNIFGTAGGSSYTGKPRWKKVGGGDSGGEDEDDGDRGKGLHQFFGGGSEKRTSMRMTYAGAGYPLSLILAEDSTGPTTTCEISTYDAEDHLELSFEEPILKIILKSSWLRDALSELDPSCEKLTLTGHPPPSEEAIQAKDKQKGKVLTKPMFRIQATGAFGGTEMDYPNDRDVMETFECAQTVSFSYRFSHIARALRAVQSSTKTSLRIDDEGLLSLQLLMPQPNPKAGRKDGATDAFVEFRCLALEDD